MKDWKPWWWVCSWEWLARRQVLDWGEQKQEGEAGQAMRQAMRQAKVVHDGGKQ